jgi:hypothetical protein
MLIGMRLFGGAFERGCQQHGIRIAYRPPATPRFGGHIERLMGTLMTRVQALPGRTFSNVTVRGDYPSESRAVLSFREFERILVPEVLGPYHNEVHAALGCPPAAAWREGAVGLEMRMPADPVALLLDFLPLRGEAKSDRAPADAGPGIHPGKRIILRVNAATFVSRPWVFCCYPGSFLSQTRAQNPAGGGGGRHFAAIQDTRHPGHAALESLLLWPARRDKRGYRA